MDWQEAFYITATLTMWVGSILTLVFFGEIWRMVRQIQRSTRRVARMGNLVRYGILRRLWLLIGGGKYE